MAIQTSLLAFQVSDTVDEVADSTDSLLDSVIDAVPRIGIAAGVMFVGFVLARFLRIGLRRLLCRQHSPSFANVMSRLTSWVFVLFVALAAITITFPSVQPVDLLAGLGFFSVAVGFAFQDILENTLSGVLLLFRQPFESGDQIHVDGNEGTVEGITIRETRIRQYDGQLLVIPNRDVYKNAIRVQTNTNDRRVDFTVGVAYDTDLDRARAVIEDALAGVGEVRKDPAPFVFVEAFGASSINLSVNVWVDSSQYDARRALDASIRTIKARLDDEGIEIPFDIVTLEAARSFRDAIGGDGARSDAASL